MSQYDDLAEQQVNKGVHVPSASCCLYGVGKRRRAAGGLRVCAFQASTIFRIAVRKSMACCAKHLD